MKSYPLLTLIADDSEDDRFLFSRAVRLLPGLTVAGVTTDGVDTLAYLNGCAPYGNRTKFPYPDVILLDYEMPGYSGLEVLASLRERIERPKVILWSNWIESVNHRLAYKLGATMVCAKPVLTQDIHSILNRVLLGIPHRSSTIVPLPSQDAGRLHSQSSYGALRTMAPSVAAG